jgi:hypothetical protein
MPRALDELGGIGSHVDFVVVPAALGGVAMFVLARGHIDAPRAALSATAACLPVARTAKRRATLWKLPGVPPDQAQ